MKRITITISIVLVILCCNTLLGQTMTADQLSFKIAKKISDTLALSSAQQNQVYQTNLQIVSLKARVRNKYKNTDSIRVQLQQIENTRDGLYKSIFGNEEKYRTYLQKKHKLISPN